MGFLLIGARDFAKMFAVRATSVLPGPGVPSGSSSQRYRERRPLITTWLLQSGKPDVNSRRDHSTGERPTETLLSATTVGELVPLPGYCVWGSYANAAR